MMRLAQPPHDTLRARIARALFPAYGYCQRCGMPWKFRDGHRVPTGEFTATFSLCEPCWDAR